jgi:hypothetical protein
MMNEADREILLPLIHYWIDYQRLADIGELDSQYTAVGRPFFEGFMLWLHDQTVPESER